MSETFKAYKAKLRRVATLRRTGGLEDIFGDLPPDPHQEWRDYMDELPVQKHVQVYEPDHEYEGEANEYQHVLDPNHESASIPEQAASHLMDHGLTEPSSAPGFQPGLWYSHPDQGGDHSGHLKGLTPEEEHEVWAIMQARQQYIPDSYEDPETGHSNLKLPEQWPEVDEESQYRSLPFGMMDLRVSPTGLCVLTDDDGKPWLRFRVPPGTSDDEIESLAQEKYHEAGGR